jgi:hypothetical protein
MNTLPPGIVNSTGTACHLSSVLLLLFHALVPIRESLIALAQLEADDHDDDDDDLAMALGKFFFEYAGTDAATGKSNDDDSEEEESPAIDPTRLYKAIKKTTGIEAQSLGDAVTATIKILSSLRCNSTSNDVSTHPLIHQILTCALDSGRVRSKLVGEGISLLHSTSAENSHSRSGRQAGDDSQSRIMMTRRVKLSKQRILPNPFTLHLATLQNNYGSSSNNNDDCHTSSTTTSLLALLSSSVAPTRVNGSYQWKEPFEETCVHMDESSELCKVNHQEKNDIRNDDHWSTSTISKSLEMESLPPLWMLHLDRFFLPHHQKERSIQAHSNSLIDIPEQFDIHETFDKLHGIYNLAGAILHVSHDNDDDDNGEIIDDEEAENAGHLVTLVRIQQQQQQQQQKHQDCSSSNGCIYSYCLIDDADRTPIERDVAMELLRGSSFTFSCGDRGRCDMRGVLLVYERLSSDTTACTNRDEAIHDDLRDNDGGGDHDAPSRLLWQLQSQVRDKVLQTTMARQEAARAVVGRRLRVQWGKGKLYAGVVAAYDPITKKHLVQYDDGDVREYNLSKKTIEWL